MHTLGVIFENFNNFDHNPLKVVHKIRFEFNENEVDDVEKSEIVILGYALWTST